MEDLERGADYVRVEVRIGGKTRIVELTAKPGEKISFLLGTTHDIVDAGITDVLTRPIADGGGTINLSAHGPHLSGAETRAASPPKRWRRLSS